LAVIPAKAWTHFAVALARHPRAGGDPGTFHALPVACEKQTATASVRLKPAGSLFFADPKKSNGGF
jgi:hypothetical protein